MDKLYGGIEAGGTWFVCAVGTGPDNLSVETKFHTTTPTDTINNAIDFFREQAKKYPLTAIGIGAFGTVDMNQASPTHGHILATPKTGWANTDFAGMVRKALDVPTYIDTDVNLAALAEHRWGLAQGLDTFIYMTVGTGIGGGGMVNGKLIHGLIHPEMGHIRVPHDWNRDPFPGTCPFHEDCLEGLASAKALEHRWGQLPETLPPDHQAWLLEADYLALGLSDLICTLSPQRILMGGGVMGQAQLFPLIRERVQHILNGYINVTEILKEIDKYIVPPALGNRAGVLGAIALASQSGK
ncbi:MAG: ROK family protein [Dehalococcoidales bacterium]|nr:ROK family protein [Dehalococcoidales bacterium]